MIIVCPQCQARYRIDPSRSAKKVARVKCPGCQHLFEVSLASPTAEVAEKAGVTASRPRILIVDDARFFREMIRDILQPLPVDLEFAEEGAAAWQQLQQNPPHLVLLDLNIPGKSGYDLLREIQGEPACARMKILVMSGVERGDQVADAVRRLGADGFLNKSFTPRELQDRVRAILDL